MKVIYFHADWCSSCQMIEADFNLLKEDFPHFEFMTIDVDEHPQIAAAFKVRNIPAFVLFKNAKEVFRKSGTASILEIKEMLSSTESH